MATPTRDRQRGQMLVLFTLALVAIIAMVGLVIDGGAVDWQRRGQQNAADLAALAGADAQMNGQSATTVALGVTKNNGYENGKNGVGVTVTVDSSAGTVKVDISAPHQNYFAGVVGQSQWTVGVTATALGSVTPNTATGALPLLLPSSDFAGSAVIATYSDPKNPFTWTHGTSQAGDAPADAVSVAWTNFQLAANVDTSRVAQIIAGTLVVSVTAQLNDYLGQHNDGQHAALFGDISSILPTNGSGLDFAVPVVGPPTTGTTCNDGTHSDGCFLGWAILHVVSADQGGKTVTGYFKSGFLSALSLTGSCGTTTCPENLGGYTPLALTN